MSERRFGNDSDPKLDSSPAGQDAGAPSGPLAMLVERFGHAGAQRIIQRRMVQRAQRGADGAAADEATIQGAAERGVAGPSGALPHQAAIQKSFGPQHDVSGIQAHVGAEASEGAEAMNAEAYATGNHVAFADGAANLHTAAHEAAHVVQQRAGVQMKSDAHGAGGEYEQHADAVADKVVKGESAAELLDQVAPAGAAKAAPAAGVQRKIKKDDGTILGGAGVEAAADEIVKQLGGDAGIDLAKAKEIARNLLMGSSVMPLQKALQLIRERAKAAPADGGGAPAAEADAAAPPTAKVALPSGVQSARPDRVAAMTTAKPQGPDARENVGAAEGARMEQDHAAYDLAPMLQDVMALLRERKAIKADVPWSDGRKSVYRVIQGLDGALNTVLGAAALMGDLPTGGMASAAIGAGKLAKDSAVASANEHIAGGVSGEGAAQSTATNVGVAKAKAMVGPVSVHGANMVPILGGAAMAGQGLKQIYGALTGELPPGAAGNEQVLSEIRSVKNGVSGAVSTFNAKQAILKSPALATIIAELDGFIEWLDRQDQKARERFAKQNAKKAKPNPNSELMTAAQLKERAGEAGKWARFKSTMGGGQSTYMRILSLLAKNESLTKDKAADTTSQRAETVAEIHRECTAWLSGHADDKESPKFAAIAELLQQATDEKLTLQEAASASAASSA